MDRNQVKSEIAALESSFIELRAKQNKLVREREPFLDAVPLEGTSNWRDGEIERRRNEAARITREIAAVTTEIRKTNDRLQVARERLRETPPPKELAKLEAELADIIERREGAREVSGQLRQAIERHALAVSRGDENARQVSDGLGGELLDSKQTIATLDAAVRQLEAAIAESRREYMDRAADAAIVEAHKIAKRIIEQSAIVDAAFATAADALENRRQLRGALIKTDCVASEFANRLSSKPTVMRAMAAAGLGEFAEIDRAGAIPLAQADKGALMAVRRPQVVVAA